jgi:DNA polymerase I-like protein with 3'-5' exonuclease and polymerase domains
MTYRTSDEMLIYNALDCAVTWQCADSYMKEIEDGYTDTYNHTIELFDPLMYMMTRGIKVDHDRLGEMRSKIEQQLIDLEKQITERCGRWVNPNSPKDVKQYFYVEKNIPPYTKYNKSTGKSTITTDDKTLQRIAKGTSSRKGYFEAKLMQDYRRLRKLKGTYLEINFDKDNRLRCSYNPRGTKFGRLSSSMTVFGTGMNMQNLPPTFSGFLVADPGGLFIELDLAQAEWVIVAYDSGDASMINAIEQGLDPHAYTASQMFKIPENIIKFEDKIIGHTNDPAEVEKKRKYIKELDPYKNQWLPRTMSIRQCGKKSNHGLNYAEKHKMFALQNEITEKEAKVIVDFYHQIYPGIGLWYKRIQDQLGRNRTLTNLFGRKCRFLERWGDDLFKAAYSYNPQSTVGEIVNRGMVSIYQSNESCFKTWEILRQVHDSIHFQSFSLAPKDLARGIRTAAKYLSPELETGGRKFTIGVDCKIGYSLDRMIEIPITDGTEMEDKIKEALNDLKAVK